MEHGDPKSQETDRQQHETPQEDSYSKQKILPEFAEAVSRKQNGKVSSA